MKIFFLLFIFSSFLYGVHVRWYADYDKALHVAKKEKKILMVLLVKNNCKKCSDTIKNLFIDQPYIEKINLHVVAVLINSDQRYSYPREMYWSNVYPTLFFVHSDNEIFIGTPIYNITKQKIKRTLKEIDRMYK
jgi:thioredoxin-related protein